MTGPTTGTTGRSGRIVVTGGAGFIGSNVAERMLERGERVTIFDNLSRPNVQRNVTWLRERHGGAIDLRIGDVRDEAAVESAVAGADAVFHFAAQVAVTTSLVAPAEDFAVNARGTFNVLEALRKARSSAPLFFTSTNKVYGALPDVALRETAQRYEPEADAVRAHGIGEARPLDFHSPYGCSKGTADQYVLDYARSYGLNTVVFRMSCIYGPRQFGTEDQGWVAHFLIRALQGEAITLYGDGKQVRDVLFVGDLVDAFERARARIDDVRGQAFNIGGGPASTLSLLELLDLIAAMEGKRPAVTHEGWRTGDQRYYVSDTRAFAAKTGWAPKVGVREGVRKLAAWLREASAKPATASKSLQGTAA